MCTYGTTELLVRTVQGQPDAFSANSLTAFPLHSLLQLDEIYNAPTLLGTIHCCDSRKHARPSKLDPDEDRKVSVPG